MGKAAPTRRYGLIAAIVLALAIVGGAGVVYLAMPSETGAQLASLRDRMDGWLSDVGLVDSAVDGDAEDESAATGEGGAEPSGDEAAGGTDLAAVEEPQKFTQRLQPDGTEVDGGPDGGPSNGVGEGTSVSPQTIAAAGGAAAIGDNAAETASDAETTEDSAQEQAVQVGQRAIYSEERTANEDLRRLQGSVVWERVQESPGPNLEPEPAIRGDLYIPDNGTSMRMTLKRNGDPSLPASHVLELIFEPTTQEPGRGIREIMRMMLKETEAAAGEPLRAFPAKIGENFFLMILDEGDQARRTNLELLRNQNWFDLLVTLDTGRRALFTLEKGLPGQEIVEEVFEYWDENPLSSS